MRVLHVAETLVGGVATYLNELISRQKDLGYEQVGLVAPDDQVGKLSTDVRDFLDLQTYSRSGRNASSLYCLWQTIRESCQHTRPSLVHAHSSFAGLVTRLPLLGVAPIPVVYCAHGWAFDMDVSPAVRQFYIVLERWLARRTAAVITLSADQKARALRQRFPESRVHFLPCGISDARLLHGDKPVRSGPLRLLFVGRFDRQKGLDWLLRLVADLPEKDFELHLVGAGVHEGHFSLPESDNLVVHGWVSQDGLDSMYDHSDAVIMPSRWEGLGLVALEAMRRATAVLASDRGALPEVLSEGGGVVFSLEKPENLKAFLLSTNRQTLDAIGKQGRQRYIQHYTNTNMHRDMDALYKRVLSI